MSTARDARSAAEAAAAAAEVRADEAGADWRDHVQGNGYDPAYGRWLAGRQIERAEEQGLAEVKAELSGQTAQRRQSEWQMLEAQVRCNEQKAQRIGRAIAHGREEKRLNALADRTTYGWLKP